MIDKVSLFFLAYDYLTNVTLCFICFPGDFRIIFQQRRILQKVPSQMLEWALKTPLSQQLFSAAVAWKKSFQKDGFKTFLKFTGKNMYFNKAADGWRNTVKLSRTLFLGRLRATVFLSLRALHLTANLLLQNMYDLVDLFRNLYIKLLSVFFILFQ